MLRSNRVPLKPLTASECFPIDCTNDVVEGDTILFTERWGGGGSSRQRREREEGYVSGADVARLWWCGMVLRLYRNDDGELIDNGKIRAPTTTSAGGMASPGGKAGALADHTGAGRVGG